MLYLIIIVFMVFAFIGMKNDYKEKTGSGCLGWLIAVVLALLILGKIFLV